MGQSYDYQLHFKQLISIKFKATYFRYLYLSFYYNIHKNNDLKTHQKKYSNQIVKRFYHFPFLLLFLLKIRYNFFRVHLHFFRTISSSNIFLRRD